MIRLEGSRSTYHSLHSEIREFRTYCLCNRKDTNIRRWSHRRACWKPNVSDMGRIGEGKGHKLLAHASVLAILFATQRPDAAIQAGISIKALTVIRSGRKIRISSRMFSYVRCELFLLASCLHAKPPRLNLLAACRESKRAPRIYEPNEPQALAGIYLHFTRWKNNLRRFLQIRLLMVEGIGPNASQRNEGEFFFLRCVYIPFEIFHLKFLFSNVKHHLNILLVSKLDVKCLVLCKALNLSLGLLCCELSDLPWTGDLNDDFYQKPVGGKISLRSVRWTISLKTSPFIKAHLSGFNKLLRMQIGY